MAKAKRRISLWRSDWLVGLVSLVAVVALQLGTELLTTMERRFYDFASTSNSRQPSPQIALIAIDDQSIANIGRWPWPRDVHAKLIDQLSAAGAKTIVHSALFFEPQTDRGLAYIQQIKAALAKLPEAERVASADITALAEKAELALDTDSVLAAALARSGRVLLPSVFVLGQPLGGADQPLPAFALRSAVADPQGFARPAVKSQQPIEALGKAAVAVGHLNQVADADGAVRQEALLVNYYGQAVPSLALAAAAAQLNLPATALSLRAPDGVQLGRLLIPTDASAQTLPQFYRASEAGRPAFAVDSFYDVLSGKIAANKYAGKLVLIGATAAGLGVSFPTPVAPAMAPVEIMAHLSSSLISEHFLRQPSWGWQAALATLLLVALYVMLVLPRLSAALGAVLTATLLATLLITEFALLASAYLWLQLVLPAAALVLGHLALTTKRFLVTEAGKLKSDEESAEANRMMGLALQGQGQLDMAFDRFRRVPMGEALMDNLYNLALDFERRRQFNKAQAVYEHMSAWDKRYKDLDHKIKRAKNLSETVILGGGAGHPGGTVLLDSGAVEKPMLGRYQVEKELGKGAMGAVYLGRDPKIGRVVAIKTLALSQEFEGDALADARERFFREAQTAGRLTHPNIVTIYDAGEEHDLAYIAMEFLHGRDLVDHCKPGNLLEVGLVLNIGSQIALALAYAHQHNIVHRDIKPANVMFDAGSATVKVTDFGIARITDASKTKTGLVLGTPSYMSPEQIAGQKIDGRSDLYSLGVMLFQLLSGTLPFRGDSMAELMYRIANAKAPDICALRTELPPALSPLLERLLAKQPEQRYQNGEQLAADLQRVAQQAQTWLATQRMSPDGVPPSAANTTIMQPDSGSGAYAQTNALSRTKPE